MAMQSQWDRDIQGLIEQLQEEGVSEHGVCWIACQMTPDLYQFAREWDESARAEKAAYLEDQMREAITRIDAMREARKGNQ